jgi:hypothetical protein
MVQAENPHSPNPPWRPLSALFVDPSLADAFARAERGPAGALTVPDPSSVAPAGEAAGRAPHDGAASRGLGTPAAFQGHLEQLCAAARLAYGLASHPMPLTGVLRAAGSGADPELGQDLLDVIGNGHEIADAVVNLLAYIRRALEEVVS